MKPCDLLPKTRERILGGLRGNNVFATEVNLIQFQFCNLGHKYLYMLYKFGSEQRSFSGP